MLPAWCIGCHQAMPRHTRSGYCDHCNPNQPPLKRSWLGKLFLWACLIGALLAGGYVVMASAFPAESIEPCAAYTLGWDGAETCPSAWRGDQ